MKKLADLPMAEIRSGNVLIISCQGGHKCGGYIRIPFSPGIGGAPDGKPSKEGGCVWRRISGVAIDDITLAPSIDVAECGHFYIQDGAVTK